MIRGAFPRLQAVAAQNGVEMGTELPLMGLDTRAAHEASKFVARTAAAREQAFHHRIYRVHFVEGGNISERETLLSAAREVGGIDVEGLAESLATGADRQAVIDDENEARARGITGVPAIFAAGRPISMGFQPAAQLLDILDTLVPR